MKITICHTGASGVVPASMNGGTAPNVVQDHAVIRYEVRAPWVSQVKELFERVKNVARGASIMTDTTVECQLSMAFTEYIPNYIASLFNFR